MAKRPEFSFLLFASATSLWRLAFPHPEVVQGRTSRRLSPVAMVLGFTYPEAELRQKRSAAPGGRVGPPRFFPGGPTLLSGVKQYVQIPTPALFLVSSQSPGAWAELSTDPVIRGQIGAMSALLERQAKAIQEALPSARVVKLLGANHYVFLSNEAAVLREMRAFLGRRR